MSISAIIIAKNEEQMISNCIETLRWCDEVLVIDHGSDDRTAELAKHAGAKVFTVKSGSIIDLRNRGMKEATGEWLLYIDVDERVTPALMREIKRAIRVTDVAAYGFRRNNIHYGKWMQHGGWEKDIVIRLFRQSALHKWSGEIHEHAEFSGEHAVIHEPLVHLTHRNLMDGLQKSMEWTPLEAELMLQANHPHMSTLRLIKVTVMEFFTRFFVKKAWKDGIEGTIESLVQAMNRFFVYEQLWELQRKPKLEETYHKIEREITALWEKDSK